MEFELTEVEAQEIQLRSVYERIVATFVQSGMGAVVVGLTYEAGEQEKTPNQLANGLRGAINRGSYDAKVLLRNEQVHLLRSSVPEEEH